MTSSLLLPLTNVKSAPSEQTFSIRTDFFRGIGESPVLAADVQLVTVLRRDGTGFALELRYDGMLTLSCDRCLQDMDFPVHFSNAVQLRRDGEGLEDEDGREIIDLDASAKEFDAAQLVYDDLCLAIPIRHCHPEGGCDERFLSYLTDKPGGEEETLDTPFSALKELNFSKN